MDASGQNYKDTFRYTDVEYTPDGHTDVYRWDDFLGIAGGHVYSAMDTIDMVSTGGQYEGDEPEHAYACEVVGCCGLSDGVALFRPVSHDGADLIQIAFLRNDVDDATGAYTERFEAGSFDLPAADLPRSESRVDLLEYFSGRSFKHTPGVNRGLDPREAVDSIEDAIGCNLGLFDGFWLGVLGEADMRVGPYTKKSLLDFSYYAKELSCRYGLADSDILEIARHLPEDCPDRLAAVKAYLDCEYVPDGNASDEKAYRWGDFLDIAGGNARYAAMLIDRTSPGEPEEGLHPETLVDQDIRETETFTLAGRPGRRFRPRALSSPGPFERKTSAGPSASRTGNGDHGCGWRRCGRVLSAYSGDRVGPVPSFSTERTSPWISSCPRNASSTTGPTISPMRRWMIITNI